MDFLPLVLIVFLAALVQTISGFGFSLLVMPLVTMLLGLQTAAPLVALAGLTLYTINLFRYRRAVNAAEVARLGAASVLGVPAGVWALVHASESFIKLLMGAILIGYGVYALTRPAAIRIRSNGWSYFAGFLAGCLGGAYNTPGPPVVVYGSLRQWSKDEFRSILQTLFFITGAVTVSSHLVARRLTPAVFSYYAFAAPALLSGLLAGSRIDARVDRALFRRIVTVMIVILGVSLALSS